MPHDSEGLYVCWTDATQSDRLTLDLASGTAKDCRPPHPASEYKAATAGGCQQVSVGSWASVVCVDLNISVDTWCLLLSFSTFIGFSKIYLFLSYVYRHFTYMYVHHVCVAPGSQKRMPAPS